MNDLPLPRIPDLQAGMAYLSRLPLANPVQALPALRKFYDSLMRDPPPLRVLLQLLEQARLPLATVLDVHAQRFRNKSLPLAETEEAAFVDTTEFWEVVAGAYARCAQLDPGRDAGHADRIALVLHRCIHYIGLAIHEHFLARRELAPGMWLDLFGYYASAEEWGIATRPIVDPLEPVQSSTHCAAALVTVLLTDLAGPYSFSLRQIMLVRRWASLWSPLVSIHHASVGDSLPEYVVDLEQDVGLKFSQDMTPNKDQRRLDTSRLAIQIKQVQIQLNQRVSPSLLGLGQDISSSECQTMLESLSRPWTQASSPRRFKRRPATGVATTALGFEAIHYFISGTRFHQPDSLRQYSRKEFDTLFAFRHQVDPMQELEVQKRELDFPTDQWQVLNQSANGFRLERGLTGQRLAHRQLLGLRPPDGERMLLAQIHWLMQTQNDGLIAGVGVLPGTPAASAARFTGINVSPQEPFTRIFMLPEIPLMNSPNSLVLPAGWYDNGRVIEIHTEIPWRAKLTSLIQRGADFDQVTYAMTG